jgi:hypothetical protein
MKLWIGLLYAFGVVFGLAMICATAAYYVSYGWKWVF